MKKYYDVGEQFIRDGVVFETMQGDDCSDCSFEGTQYCDTAERLHCNRVDITNVVFVRVKQEEPVPNTDCVSMIAEIITATSYQQKLLLELATEINKLRSTEGERK